MTAEEFSPVTPVNFVQIRTQCHYLNPENQGFGGDAEHDFLPDTSALCDEDPFADVAIGWDEEGLSFLVHVYQPIQQVTYPDLSRGDNVELFIDTRDVKTSGFNTRFCHHFFFLPESVGGNLAGEITRFRTEDKHDLCDPKELKVKTEKRKERYSLTIHIPASCLHGYDPSQFDRIGFSYRINRPDGPSQHFSVVSEDYRVEQQPSLWASIRLKK